MYCVSSCSGEREREKRLPAMPAAPLTKHRCVGEETQCSARDPPGFTAFGRWKRVLPGARCQRIPTLTQRRPMSQHDVPLSCHLRRPPVLRRTLRRRARFAGCGGRGRAFVQISGPSVAPVVPASHTPVTPRSCCHHAVVVLPRRPRVRSGPAEARPPRGRTLIVLAIASAGQQTSRRGITAPSRRRERRR